MTTTDPRRDAVAAQITEARATAARFRSHAAELIAQADELDARADLNAAWLAGH